MQTLLFISNKNTPKLMAFMLAVLFSLVSLAQENLVLYAVDGEFDDTQANRTSRLYEIDPDTAAVIRNIGDTGERIKGLTILTETNQLYGLTSADSLHANSIVAIDVQTAEIEVIGVVDFDAIGFDFDIQDIDSRTTSLITDSNTIALVGVGDELVGNSNRIEFFDLGSGDFTDFNNILIGNVSLQEPDRFGFSIMPNNDSPSIVIGCDLPGFDSPMLSYEFIAFQNLPIDPPPFLPDLPLSPVGCVISSDFSAPGMLFGLEEVNPDQPQRNLIKLEIPQFPTLPLPDVLTVETVGGLPDFISAIAFGRIQTPAVPAIRWEGIGLLLLLIMFSCLSYRRYISSRERRLMLNKNIRIGTLIVQTHECPKIMGVYIL